jgi:hypothetical protein
MTKKDNHYTKNLKERLAVCADNHLASGNIEVHNLLNEAFAKIEHLQEMNGVAADMLVRQGSEINTLNDEIEKLRLQLAACGVIANANTRESASKERQYSPDIACAGLSDVEDAIDREIYLRESLNELLTQINEHHNTFCLFRLPEDDPARHCTCWVDKVITEVMTGNYED